MTAHPTLSDSERVAEAERAVVDFVAGGRDGRTFPL